MVKKGKLDINDYDMEMQGDITWTIFLKELFFIHLLFW